MNFSGKTAFITGAGGFIGSDNARKLASLGASVAVCDINEANVNKTVEEIKQAGGRAIGIVTDVTSSQSVDDAVKRTVDTFGGIDMAIHVAGGSARKKMKKLVEQSDEVIESVLNINLLGAFWVSRAAAREMIKQGRGGKILCYSSIIGVCGGIGCTDYAAAKGGISSFVKSLAKELGEYQINVNAIAPGVVMRPDEPFDVEERAIKTNLFHKRCTANDVSELAAFLVSDAAGFVTGQTYVIDGGRSLSLKGSD